MRSSRRPGHATTMSTPRCSAVTWPAWRRRRRWSWSTGPRPWRAARGCRAPAWRARGSAAGRARAGGRGRRARALGGRRRATSGSAKAMVLPLPVRPRPSTSRPDQRVGQRRRLDRERRLDALLREHVDEVLRHAEHGEVGARRRLRDGGLGHGRRRVRQAGARVGALRAVGAAARPVAARVVTGVRGDGHGTFRVEVVTRMTARSTLERSEGARDASSVTVVRSRAGAPQPVTGPEARGAALLERVPVVRRESPRGQCHPELGEMCPGYRSGGHP